MTLCVESLSLTLGQRQVLFGVTSRFAAGQVAVIMGPNGAGKTSLIRVLAGLVSQGVKGGGVTLDGVALAKLDPAQRARQIGYLPQGGNPAWNVTARELIGLGRLPHRVRFAGPTAADQAAVEQAMVATDTRHLAERTLDAMSGGERARVLLARVLAGDPKWLLADEPMASLDPAHRIDIVALLRAEAARGRGVITVLHDLSLAAQLADRIVMLGEGRVIAQGPPHDVMTAPVLAAAYGITADISQSADGKLTITPTGRT